VYYITEYMNRDSSVGMARGYGLDGQGSITGRKINFSLLHRVRTGFYLMGTGRYFPWVKAVVA
jgi:hypothetical protein